LMQPAADAMAEALADVEFQSPSISLIANVRANVVTDAALIKELLVEQVTGSVRWRESVAFMAAQGVTETFEIGAGKALSGMVWDGAPRRSRNWCEFSWRCGWCCSRRREIRLGLGICLI